MAEQDRGLTSRVGPVEIDWPMAIGYYGGIGLALAFEMRHFASDSIREVPGFLNRSLADNEFFRHDRPLLDKHLFFADGNPDRLTRSQFDQCAE